MLDQLKTQAGGLIDQAFSLGQSQGGGGGPPAPPPGTPAGVTLTGNIVYVVTSAANCTIGVLKDAFNAAKVLVTASVPGQAQISKSFLVTQVSVVKIFGSGVRKLIFENTSTVPHELFSV